MKEYKKTYLPLIVWCVVLLPVMLGPAFLAEGLGLDDRGIVALMMIVVELMVIGLMWIIQLGGYVYWINGGPSFEEAKAAGEAVRWEYAHRHLKTMRAGGFTAAALAAILWLLGANEILIVLLPAVCIIAATFKTMAIRWPEEVHIGDPED